MNKILLSMTVIISLSATAADKQLLWGDTHLHTSYSVDAFFLGNQSADPDTAYRWAKGQPVIHPYNRVRLQLSQPLDFLVVSDHAELMGVPRSLMQQDPILNSTAVGRRYLNMVKEGKSREVFDEMLSGVTGDEAMALHSEQVIGKNWGDITATADRHNNPGTFTALIGWEWSSMIEGGNLHRIVVSSANATQGNQFLPYSSIDSVDPEDLWRWLEKTSAKTGADFVSIPHNSNVSRGLMFDTVDQRGQPFTREYAEARIKWEPIVEVTQIKGDSETHPDLSPDDEFADFEYFPTTLDISPGRDSTPTNTAGDYARGALLRGLKLSQELGINPYQFGMIGSTDAHTALASADEDYFWGKTAVDSVPENKEGDALVGVDGWKMSASGLAAVWADRNDRDSILAALKRRETYASTGPRITVRLFGGFQFKPKHLNSKRLAKLGYKKGVPMGGTLNNAPDGKAPGFIVAASKEPDGANLDRIQIVKGWIDSNGESQETVFDISWSGEREKQENGRLEPVGNTVDLNTGRYKNSIGEAQLVGFWSDPEFNPAQQAFYYARVLQIPTARHSLLDALSLGQKAEMTGQPATIQERAYTSPIWYQP